MKIGVLFAALLFASGCVVAQTQPDKKAKPVDAFDEVIANLPRIRPPAPTPPEPPKRELGPIDRWLVQRRHALLHIIQRVGATV